MGPRCHSVSPAPPGQRRPPALSPATRGAATTPPLRQEPTRAWRQVSACPSPSDLIATVPTCSATGRSFAWEARAVLDSRVRAPRGLSSRAATPPPPSPRGTPAIHPTFDRLGRSFTGAALAAHRDARVTESSTPALGGSVIDSPICRLGAFVSPMARLSSNNLRRRDTVQ